MQSFIAMLLVCSIVMSAVGLLYIALTPLLVRRYSEKGLYYAWLIVMVGLVIPFRPTFSGPNLGESLPFTPLALPVAGQAAVYSAGADVSIWQTFAVVWLVGFIGFLAYYAVRYRRFVSLVRRWGTQVNCGEMLTVLRGLKREMKIRRYIPIYLCPWVGSPVMMGVFKPRILLPTLDLADGELYFILKHELMHYKRGDILCKYLVLAARALHWFNPVVILMEKTASALCEMSCDGLVVGNESIEGRWSYTETILSVVRHKSTHKNALAAHFYEGKKGIKSRISSIMDTGKKKSGAAIACMILVLVLFSGFIVEADPVQAYTPPIFASAPRDANGRVRSSRFEDLLYSWPNFYLVVHGCAVSNIEFMIRGYVEASGGNFVRVMYGSS